jgi:hypothetical protein
MAPPDRSGSYGRSIISAIIGILIGLALGRIGLTASRCAALNAAGIHPSGCMPDLKPGAMAGAKGPEFCKAPTVSTDAFITIMNAGLTEAAASSTLVAMYPPNSPPIMTMLSTPTIPAGGSHTAQLSNAPVTVIDFPIVVTADSGTVISELDENNNVLVGICSR